MRASVSNRVSNTQLRRSGRDEFSEPVAVETRDVTLEGQRGRARILRGPNWLTPRPPATRTFDARPGSDQPRCWRQGKRRSSSARAWTADSPKRRAHSLSRSSLSRKNFQSLSTVCLTNRNGAGDWNGRKLEL